MPSVHTYLKPLVGLLEAHADPSIAIAQQAYMKDLFPFFGIKSMDRKSLARSFFTEHGRPSIEDLPVIVRSAWAQPQRELHYAAMEMLARDVKRLGPEHLPLIEELVQSESWWDTVDHLASNVVGPILLRDDSEHRKWNARWMKSGELWLQRTALIHQLKWKEATNEKVLFENIERLHDHRDFFIRKAIGWALRQHGYTAPDAVRRFVNDNKGRLSGLSVREAMKHL